MNCQGSFGHKLGQLLLGLRICCEGNDLARQFSRSSSAAYGLPRGRRLKSVRLRDCDLQVLVAAAAVGPHVVSRGNTLGLPGVRAFPGGSLRVPRRGCRHASGTCQDSNRQPVALCASWPSGSAGARALVHSTRSRRQAARRSGAVACRAEGWYTPSKQNANVSAIQVGHPLFQPPASAGLVGGQAC
jgi:hypothetical protein